jgi:phosphate acetyltransferase
MCVGLLDKIIAEAKLLNKRIVLPEGDEPRTVQAAAEIVKAGIAKVVLIGNEEAIKAKAAQLSADISACEIIDPETSGLTAKYAETFYELRKSKGVTEEQAQKTAKDATYFGTLMMKLGDADGMVSGAIHSTGDTIRPSLQIIKTKPGVSVVSSCFLIELPEDNAYKPGGVLVFGDCAVIPEPTSDELAAIAIASSQTGKALAGIEPKVALLSFSSKGSAKHERVTKVQDAVKKAKELAPKLELDGELQADAALIEAVGKLKSPGSTVAGQANVLVFPSLEAGNIGYKLVERLAGAQALGPIIQGLAKPVNDLSRGCSVSDIVGMVAITAVMAK